MHDYINNSVESFFTCLLCMHVCVCVCVCVCVYCSTLLWGLYYTFPVNFVDQPKSEGEVTFTNSNNIGSNTTRQNCGSNPNHITVIVGGAVIIVLVISITAIIIALILRKKCDKISVWKPR